MTSLNFLPYARQSISDDDILAVSEALKKPIITRGTCVSDFEQAIADYCDVEYAVAFNSATSALQAACHAVQASPADRLITTPNSFVASVIGGMQRGATPVFVDIDRSTGNLNLDQVEQYLHEFQSSRGRAIILPVHFSGIAVDIERLDRTIRSPNTVIIEDAAHAIGSQYPNGMRVGSCAWSQITIFSFHPAKTMTSGEGGIATTNDADLYHRLKRFRDNGIERDPAYLAEDLADNYLGYYEVVEMTGNYHMTELQAALGISQFKRIDQFVEKRRELVTTYRKLLQDFPDVRLFSSEVDSRTAYHLFVAQVDFGAYGTTRIHVMNELRERGIGTQLHYIPIYRHPFFKEHSGDLSSFFPEMEAYYAQALSLPLYYDLTIEDVNRVVGTLKDILVEERRKKHYKKSRSKKA